jgi:hypothetical protein
MRTTFCFVDVLSKHLRELLVRSLERCLTSFE